MITATVRSEQMVIGTEANQSLTMNSIKNVKNLLSIFTPETRLRELEPLPPRDPPELLSLSELPEDATSPAKDVVIEGKLNVHIIGGAGRQRPEGGGVLHGLQGRLIGNRHPGAVIQAQVRKLAPPVDLENDQQPLGLV